MEPVSDTSDQPTTIWRYMDFPKFASMLATRQLWFPKASELHNEDPYEGFCRATYLEVDGSIPRISEASSSGPRSISFEEFGALFWNNTAESYDTAWDRLYVNSWCLGERESMAMWQIYGGTGAGVVIRSSFEQYARAAKFNLTKDHYRFGAVSYHENLEEAIEVHRHFSGGIPMGGHLFQEVLKLGFHKRSCFKHENEWRAAVYQDRRSIPGLDVDFDLDVLISEIRVGPRAPAFVFEAVRLLVEKFGIRKPVERSTLLTPPLRSSAVQSL